MTTQPTRLEVRANMKKFEIRTNMTLRDSRGVVWRVFEKYPFGRALLVRNDRPGTSMEMRYVDIYANMTKD